MVGVRSTMRTHASPDEPSKQPGIASVAFLHRNAPSGRGHAGGDPRRTGHSKGPDMAKEELLEFEVSLPKFCRTRAIVFSSKTDICSLPIRPGG